MRKLKVLDERELVIRGNVMMHTLALTVALFLINFTLYTFGFSWAPGRYSDMIILLLALAWLVIEMAAQGVYPMGRRRQLALDLVLGAVGLAWAGFSVYDMVSGEAVFADGMLSETGCFLVGGIIMILVPLLFFLVGKKPDEEEEGEEIV